MMSRKETKSRFRWSIFILAVGLGAHLQLAIDFDVGWITLSQAFIGTHVECPLLRVSRENSNDLNYAQCHSARFPSPIL